MENTIVAIFVALALVIGMIGGAVITPNETETIVEYQDKIVEVPVNVSVDKIVEIAAPNQLELAVTEFMQAVEYEEVNDSDVDVLSDFTVGNYDFGEVEISRIYNDYTVEYEDDKTIVDFSIKLRFDEDGEASEKETFDVTVIFEDDEDTKVIVA